jgi:hypothetical protein
MLKRSRQGNILYFSLETVSDWAAMNHKKFPWNQLIFVFLLGLILGFLYLPLESISLHWLVLIIAIPVAAIIYVIADEILTALIKDLNQFLGEFVGNIVSLLILISGGLLGSIIFNWLTVLIKSLTA